MTAILGTWNPALAPWPGMAGVVAATARGERVVDSWSVARRRYGIEPGDRFFLLKVGKPPRGIVGSGTILSEPYAAPHWDGTPGKITKLVDVEFDRVIDRDQVLVTSTLSEQLRNTYWKPTSSGTTIDPADVERLEALWSLHLSEL
jgi:5-methylcytosine-specific restriction protein A